MLKLLKNALIMAMMLCGLQLFCDPFVANLVRDRGSGKEVGGHHVNIDLDTSDTAAQAKEKIHKQLGYKIKGRTIIVRMTNHSQFAWPDELTYEELIQRRIDADEDQKDRSSGNFNEKNIREFELMNTNLARKYGLLMLEDKAPKGKVKKKMQKRKGGLEIKL